MKGQKFSIYRLASTKQDIITQKLKILEFFDKYGAEATRDAFGVSRNTVLLWKRKLKEHNYNPSALLPCSRKPHNPRRPEWHPEIVEYIKSRRWECPRLGQYALKSELDELCAKRGVKPPSESTIARIIKSLKKRGEIIDPKVKVSLYGRTGRIVIRTRKKKKKLRRKGFYPRKPGDMVEIDASFWFINDLRIYIFSAIDVHTRFAFAYAYTRLSSANARDFLEKLLKVAP